MLYMEHNLKFFPFILTTIQLSSQLYIYPHNYTFIPYLLKGQFLCLSHHTYPILYALPDGPHFHISLPLLIEFPLPVK